MISHLSNIGQLIKFYPLIHFDTTSSCGIKQNSNGLPYAIHCMLCVGCIRLWCISNGFTVFRCWISFRFLWNRIRWCTVILFPIMFIWIYIIFRGSSWVIFSTNLNSIRLDGVEVKVMYCKSRYNTLSLPPFILLYVSASCLFGAVQRQHI